MKAKTLKARARRKAAELGHKLNPFRRTTPGYFRAVCPVCCAETVVGGPREMVRGAAVERSCERYLYGGRRSQAALDIMGPADGYADPLEDK